MYSSSFGLLYCPEYSLHCRKLFSLRSPFTGCLLIRNLRDICGSGPSFRSFWSSNFSRDYFTWITFACRTYWSAKWCWNRREQYSCRRSSRYSSLKCGSDCNELFVSRTFSYSIQCRGDDSSLHLFRSAGALAAGTTTSVVLQTLTETGAGGSTSLLTVTSAVRLFLQVGRLRSK